MPVREFREKGVKGVIGDAIAKMVVEMHEGGLVGDDGSWSMNHTGPIPGEIEVVHDDGTKYKVECAIKATRIDE